MPSLRSRLRAAYEAFRSPELVDVGMTLETEAFEAGYAVGYVAAQRREREDVVIAAALRGAIGRPGRRSSPLQWRSS